MALGLLAKVALWKPSFRCLVPPTILVVHICTHRINGCCWFFFLVALWNHQLFRSLCSTSHRIDWHSQVCRVVRRPPTILTQLSNHHRINYSVLSSFVVFCSFRFQVCFRCFPTRFLGSVAPVATWSWPLRKRGAQYLNQDMGRVLCWQNFYPAPPPPSRHLVRFMLVDFHIVVMLKVLSEEF